MVLATMDTTAGRTSSTVSAMLGNWSTGIVFPSDAGLVGKSCLEVINGLFPGAAWAVGVGCLDVTNGLLEQADDAITAIITKAKGALGLVRREITVERPMGLFMFMKTI